MNEMHYNDEIHFGEDYYDEGPVDEDDMEIKDDPFKEADRLYRVQ